MTFEEYDIQAQKTIPDLSWESLMLHSSLGVAGEAGEIADIIKKAFFQGHEIDFDKLKLEIGDVLWSLNELCFAIGTDLEEVATLNIEKLQKRYNGKFSFEASVNRLS